MPNSINLALKKNTIASGYVKPYESARAVDGLFSTTNQLNRWLCNGVSASSPAKLVVDLGAISVINRWVVRHMSVAGWRTPDYNMSDFKLQISIDNATWTDVDSVVGNTNSITDRSISSFIIGRYVRLYITKGLNTNPQLASLMEFEVYGYTTPYLGGLTVNSGQLTLNPSFAPLTFTYAIADVPNSTSSINITPIAQDPRATIKVNNVAVASGSATSVALSVGSNTINIVVTSIDGTTTQAYTLTVVRQPALELSGLTISAGTLNPSFTSNILAYTSNVGYDVTSTTVTPSTNISGATITVNGVTVASGTASAPINLNIGSNTINVVLTKGTDTKTYTLNVTRASSAYLTNLVINNGMLNSAFAKTTLSYNATIGYDLSDFNITPTAEDSNATITVDSKIVTSGQPSQNFTLNVGNNITIPVNVTSADGREQKAYSIVANKPDGPYLTNLVIQGVMLGFNSKTFRYTKSVSSSTTSVKVTPTIADSSVSISVNGSTVVSGQQSNPITISSGSNNITVQVKSGTIIMGTYIVTLMKP